MSLLEIDEVAIGRGDRLLFEGLSLTLSAGDVATVVGANGTGKTSLLRVVAGLGLPQSGQIRWRAVAVHSGDPVYARQRLFLGHQPGLKADLSVAENLRFLLELQGVEHRDHEARACLAELGLSDAGARPVRALSAGQRRRVALARLRLAGCALWLLDEPLTNLDADGQALVARWLGEHLAGGGLAMVASHAPIDVVVPGRRLQVELGA